MAHCEHFEQFCRIAALMQKFHDQGKYSPRKLEIKYFLVALIYA